MIGFWVVALTASKNTFKSTVFIQHLSHDQWRAEHTAERFSEASCCRLSNLPSRTGKRMGKLPDTPRTFLFGQTLGHERDGTEELRMPEFVCMENHHEHNAEVILVTFHAIFLPEPPEGPQGVRSPLKNF